jgi:hypothetical protein
VLLFTSALDTTWTDLPKRALFAPFVHESLAYLSGASSADLGEAVIGDRPSAGGSRYESPGLAEEPTPSGPRMVAVNVDPQESDLRPADLTALQTRLQAAAAVSEEPRDPGPAVDVERGNEELVQLEREQRWWWWLMWGVLGLALGEMVLANRTR